MKAQKYSSSPCPNGCRGVAGRAARRMPCSSRNWLPVSTTECTASLHIAELPVTNAATALVAAMAPLPSRAARMTRRLGCPRAGAVGAVFIDARW